MNQYLVDINICKTIENIFIEADTPEEARNKALKKWQDGVVSKDLQVSEQVSFSTEKLDTLDDDKCEEDELMPICKDCFDKLVNEKVEEILKERKELKQ